jgi:glycosyltransferase involved in cell wall biosynthesis
MALHGAESPNPLSVLFLAPTGAGQDRYGGAGTSIARLLRFADRSRLRAELAHGIPGHPFVPEFQAQHRCGRAAFSARLLDRMAFLSSGRRWVRREASRFDVAISITSMYSALSLADAARRRGCPVVARIENSTRGLPRRPWYGRIRDVDSARYMMLRKANAVIAMSSLVQEELLLAGVHPARVARIPQHCDTRLFVPQSQPDRSTWRRNLGWPDRFTFLCVGEVVPRKRQLLLVNALAQLVHAGHDVQLALVGPMQDVRYGRSMQEAIGALGLDDRILLTGFTRQVQFTYFASDAFVLASTNENMPGSLVEAAACGLPAVVSDFAGASDVVEVGQSGWIVPQGHGELDLWVECLGGLAREGSAATFGARAREIAVAQFDSRIVWPQYERVLRDAAHEGARR